MLRKLDSTAPERQEFSLYTGGPKRAHVLSLCENCEARMLAGAICWKPNSKSHRLSAILVWYSKQHETVHGLQQFLRVRLRLCSFCTAKIEAFWVGIGVPGFEGKHVTATQQQFPSDVLRRNALSLMGCCSQSFGRKGFRG